MTVLVEILVEGRDDALTVVFEHPPRLAELPDAPFEWFGGVGLEGIGDGVEGLCNTLDGGHDGKESDRREHTSST